MDTGAYIKQLRNEKGISQTELGKIVGVQRAAVQKWECGITQNLKRETIKKLADYFNVSPSSFICDDFSSDSDLSKYGIHPIEKKKFRMLGSIACGEPIYCDEDYQTFIEASADINADFCLTAKGDSMINARIYDGDVVFIKSTPEVYNGEIAAVVVDDEATLKRVYYYKEENKVVLVAENPKYAPLVYVNEELNHINILGRAVAFMSNIK